MTIRSKKVATRDVVDATELALEEAEVSADESIQEAAKELTEREPEAINTQFTLTLYSSTVCSPCKTIKPILEKQLLGRSAKYEVITINPNDLDEKVKAQFEDAGVTQVPTLIYKAGDKELGKLTGYTGTKQLLDTLKNWGVI